jgi:hypothetical protein
LEFFILFGLIVTMKNWEGDKTGGVNIDDDPTDSLFEIISLVQFFNTK